MKRSNELTETLSNLIAQQPFIATYLLNNMDIIETTEIKTADTNGSQIRFNPEWFGKMPIKERVFVTAHEVMHGILQHMQRGKLYSDRGFGPDLKPYRHDIANKAEDYIINAMLINAKIGTMPAGGLFSSEIKGTELMDEVYVELNAKEDDPDSDNKDKESKAGNSEGGDGQGQAQGHGGFDEHREPEKGAGLSEEENKTAVAQAAQAAEAMGKMPASLKRLVGALLDPEISWEEQFRNTITARAGHDTATWRRPNRRRLAIAPHIYYPGRTGHQMGGLVIAIDVSGSINQPMLDRFFSESIGLLEEVKAEWIKVITVNTQVKEEFDIEEPCDMLDLDITGGGGTRLETLAEYMSDNDIDAEQVVWFTDGITSYSTVSPFACDVVWCLTTDRRVPPYGAVINMK